MTARVAANRFWEKIFGIGLVASEEFGAQGELPSHPGLLDWLATEFIRSGWGVKAFLNLLVTSRLTSKILASPMKWQSAIRLTVFWPVARVRLSAEMIRDQALAVSGLLSSKMYGAPVRPPQPNMGLRAAFGGGIDWKTSTGEDRYRRRALHHLAKIKPYPSMTTFDAPYKRFAPFAGTYEYASSSARYHE